MRNPLKLILAATALLAAAPLLSAEPKGDEPVAVPHSIKQGIDFVYVDPAMSAVAKRHQKPRNWLSRIFQRDNRSAPNPLFHRLSAGLDLYRATWGSLPQIKIPVNGSTVTLVPACRSWWARSASPGDMWTGPMNHSGL